MMEEPTIITWGRDHIEKYSTEEMLAAVRRGFEGRGEDAYFVLDSFPHGQRFLAAAAALAIDKGLLYCSDEQDEGQSTIWAFKLTELGRATLLK